MLAFLLKLKSNLHILFFYYILDLNNHNKSLFTNGKAEIRIMKRRQNENLRKMKKFTLLMLIVFMMIKLQAQNKLLSQIDEFYDGTSWQKFAGTNYEYDNNNNLIVETYCHYDSNANTWKISYKDTYTYDSSNKVTLIINQDWNEKTNKFENDYRDSYAYSNGKYIGGVFQKWDGSSWVNDSKSEFTYKNNGLLQSSLTYMW